MPDKINAMDLLFGEPAAPQRDVQATAGTEPGAKIDGLDLLFGEASAPKIRNETLSYDPQRTLGFMAQAKGSFASDDEEWVRHAAKTLYPGEPLESSVKRFGRTEEGRYFHKGDDGKLYEVTPPGWSLSNVGAGVGYSIPIGAGTVAGITTAPMLATGPGAALSIAATGGAGATGEWIRQGVGDLILGDAATNELDPMAIGKEGIMSAAGQGLAAGLGRWAERYAAPDIERLSTAAAKELYDKADKIGVKLTPAEATGLESQIAEQKRLKGVPESANIMVDFYRQRNRDASAAFRSFLDTISPPQDAGRLGETAHRSAQRMTAAAQGERTQAVTPFYEQAEREIGFVNPADVVRYIDQELPTAKGPIRTALEYARQQLTTRGGTIPPTASGAPASPIRAAIQHLAGEEATDTSFRGLDNAKKAIDAILQNEDLAARKGIDRSAYYALERVRGLLVRALDTAAGNSGAYAAGRRTYEGLTQSVVEPLEQALAPLMRVNPQRGTMLVNAAKAMLDPATRSPELVAAARRAFTAGPTAQPQVWNALVRQYLQQEAHAALQTMAKGELGNVTGNIAKKIGDENVMANLRAALPPGKIKELEDLLDVFRAASRSLDINSDTAFKLAAEATAKRRDMGATAKAVEWFMPWDKLKAMRDFFADRNYAKQAETIAKIMTSGDRSALNKLRALKQYKPTDWRRLSVIADALVRSGQLGVEEVTD